jgi:hypothetical protein
VNHEYPNTGNCLDQYLVDQYRHLGRREPGLQRLPNSIDNDGDGKADCVDRDCRNDVACTGGTVSELCDDGIDNDADGKTDCADKKDCNRDPAC